MVEHRVFGASCWAPLFPIPMELPPLPLVSPQGHGCCWETSYIFASGGLVVEIQIHLAAEHSDCCSPSNVNEEGFDSNWSWELLC